MILQICLVFVATFLAGYFAGGAFNKRKKKKKSSPEQSGKITTLRSVEATNKKETLN